MKDFAWWSGLTMNEVKTGIKMSNLEHKIIDGKTFWFAAGQQASVRFKAPSIHLLPNYDEYLIAYKDHSHILNAALLKEKKDSITKDALMAHIIVLNGKVIGGWRRTIQKNEITITTNLLVRLNKIEQSALKLAAKHYSRFMMMPVTLL